MGSALALGDDTIVTAFAGTFGLVMVGKGRGETDAAPLAVAVFTHAGGWHVRCRFTECGDVVVA